MILIGAIPLKRGPLFDYRNEHFINPDKIVSAQFSPQLDVSERRVNVILEDKSEWTIAREVFDSMRLFYTKESD